MCVGSDYRKPPAVEGPMTLDQLKEAVKMNAAVIAKMKKETEHKDNIIRSLVYDVLLISSFSVKKKKKYPRSTFQ